MEGRIGLREAPETAIPTKEGRRQMLKGIRVTILALVVLIVSGYAGTAVAEDVREAFDGVTKVELSSVSGDCIVMTHRSDEVIVELFYDVKPEGSFEYEMRKSGKTLVIKEKWGRGGRHKNMSGDVSWTLTVPADTEIEFSTASGDITASGLTKSIEASTASGDIDLKDMEADIDISTASGSAELVNLKGNIDISTASGDIDIEDSSGDIELSTASGDIDATGVSGEFDLGAASGDISISDARGIFDVGCASGDIDATGVTIEGSSEFSTASGDVEVSLAVTCEYDLELSAASGDVVLDYNGNKVKGFFEFTAHKRRGKIVCPFDFDEEEEFEQNGETYVRKSFSRGGDTPEIELSTASGKAVLKK
jgi:DUF4097 and DUF4098 domain-containing protein YvlB